MRKKTPKYDQESVLFTSDLHFFHKAQVKRRGFSTAENMNGFLIRRWNARVYPWHTVFVLGDVSLGNAADTMGVLEQLNGNLHLIRGNHDKGLQSKVLNMFGSVSDYAEIDLVSLSGTKQRVVMSHYAMRVWNRSHFGSWQLYGHSHGNLPPIGKQMDVGVDTHPILAPYTSAEVSRFMSQREISVVDHHVPKELK